MRTFKNLEAVPPPQHFSALTIGNFDGVHLGHQAVLNHLKQISVLHQGSCAVITFDNHPSQILKPSHPVKSICTINHKTRLIEKLGIDNLLLLSFSQQIAKLSAEQFLSHVLSIYPFSKLILGHDATIGKDKHGNYQTIREIATRLGFGVDYLPQLKFDEAGISSSRIRTLLIQGEISEVSRLLGRPYSIFSTVEPGLKNGRSLGFPTLNINTDGLCLPPLGVYIVYVNFNHQKIPAVANLGFAPTLKKINSPLLEVHLINYSQTIEEKEIEVVFCKYMRPEKTFLSKESLVSQICQDIQAANEFFSD